MIIGLVLSLSRIKLKGQRRRIFLIVKIGSNRKLQGGLHVCLGLTLEVLRYLSWFEEGNVGFCLSSGLLSIFVVCAAVIMCLLGRDFCLEKHTHRLPWEESPVQLVWLESCGLNIFCWTDTCFHVLHPLLISFCFRVCHSRPLLHSRPDRVN